MLKLAGLVGVVSIRSLPLGLQVDRRIARLVLRARQVIDIERDWRTLLTSRTLSISCVPRRSRWERSFCTVQARWLQQPPATRPGRSGVSATLVASTFLVPGIERHLDLDAVASLPALLPASAGVGIEISVFRRNLALHGAPLHGGGAGRACHGVEQQPPPAGHGRCKVGDGVGVAARMHRRACPDCP